MQNFVLQFMHEVQFMKKLFFQFMQGTTLQFIEKRIRTEQDKENEHLLTGAYIDVRDRNKAEFDEVLRRL